MADFVDEKKQEMQARIRDLKPLVEEYSRLEAAVAALEGVGASSGATSAPRKAPSASRRPARRKSASKGTGKRGRPKGSGTRGKQALELVRTNPGITIPELAQAMGIQQNYLYRVLPGLQKDGLVKKSGKGWHAVEAA